MTPRAWSYGLLFAGILWAALIVAWWLVMAAQTVGVEAWHDSALPASAFVAVHSDPNQVSDRVLARANEAPHGQPQGGAPTPAADRLLTVAGRSPTVSASPSTEDWTTRPGTISGTASTYGPGFDGYLALPAGRGIHVRICGAGGCIDRVSNDTGPVPSLHRVADLDVADFEAVCGLPWTRGLCRVSVQEVLGG